MLGDLAVELDQQLRPHAPRHAQRVDEDAGARPRPCRAGGRGRGGGLRGGLRGGRRGGLPGALCSGHARGSGGPPVGAERLTAVNSPEATIAPGEGQG